MNKILFLRPPFEGMNNYVPPHMGIAVLYSRCLETFGQAYEYHFLDCLLEKLDEARTATEIIDLAPEFIAITVKSMQVEQTINIIRQVKAAYNPIIVCGGNHVSVEPELFIEAGANYSVIGAGEQALVEVIKFHTSPRSEAKLDCIIKSKEVRFSTPNWKIMDISRYNENIHIDFNKKSLPIMASRGCPFKCDFCSSYKVWGNATVYRKPQEVVEEILSNARCYNITDVHFYDDNLMLNRAWMIEFLDLLQNSAVPIRWTCLSRPEIILKNSDLLEKMKICGCSGFELGFETLDSDLYDKMNKKNSSAIFQKAFSEICKHDFEMVLILLMLYYEGETFSSLYNTYSYLKKMKKKQKRFFLISRFFSTPFTGTKFYERIESKGILLSEGYKHKYAIFLNFVPFSFLESYISEYVINKQALKLRYDLLGINNLIYEKEFNLILCRCSLDLFCEKFNSMPSMATVNDFVFALKEHINYPEANKAIYEFVCRILEFAIMNGVVNEKSVVL